MTELGKANKKVLVLNADLAGTCRNKSFVNTFPDRAFNVGIAEQNMVSFAAGLACEGFIPYAFSMAPFLTMRACEQCRTDVAYGNRNVRLVGVYAGLSGGISGATHWAMEDCGIMTSIPQMAVFEVSDANQAQRLLDFTLTYDGPVYIRSGVEPVENRYDTNVLIKAGGSTLARGGTDGAILCSGVLVQYALAAAKHIEQREKISVRVVDMYSIKPVDRKAIVDAAKTGHVLVAQDHNVIGGLGSIVALTIAEAGISTKFRVVGVPDQFVAMAHAGYLYHMFGMDAYGLEKKMMALFD